VPDTEDVGDRMPLMGHLSELRRRLIISVVALVVGAIIGFILYNRILEILLRPYTEVTGKTEFVFFDPLEAFATRLKVAAWSGAFLASPVVLWQLWRFITPGLHKKEKRYAIPFIVASILLFSLGASVASSPSNRPFDSSSASAARTSPRCSAPRSS